MRNLNHPLSSWKGIRTSSACPQSSLKACAFNYSDKRWSSISMTCLSWDVSRYKSMIFSIVDMSSFERYSCTLSYESIIVHVDISSDQSFPPSAHILLNLYHVLFWGGIQNVTFFWISFLFLIEWHDQQQCRNRSLFSPLLIPQWSCTPCLHISMEQVTCSQYRKHSSPWYLSGFLLPCHVCRYWWKWVEFLILRSL